MILKVIVNEKEKHVNDENQEDVALTSIAYMNKIIGTYALINNGTSCTLPQSGLLTTMPNHPIYRLPPPTPSASISSFIIITTHRVSRPLCATSISSIIGTVYFCICSLINHRHHHALHQGKDVGGQISVRRVGSFSSAFATMEERNQMGKVLD